MKVTPSSFVTIDYLIRTAESETFPDSGTPEELSFCLGCGLMPPDLEQALLGMSVHEHKVVTLSPEQAFGPVDDKLIQQVPLADFGQDRPPEPGDIFETVDEEGHTVYFVVRQVEADLATIDFNHPLAGKDVEFAITLKGVREASPEDIKGCTCGACGGDHPH